MIKIVLCLILNLALVLNVHAASTAKQVDFLQAGLEVTGDALSGGKVFTYESGTTTAKECYLDRAKASPATNPIILDTEGRATVFCDGIYKMVVKSALDVTLITMDGFDYGNTGLQVTALSSYGGLEEAVNDIGATKTVLMLDTTDTLNSNVTVPTNITLAVFARDAITLNGKTLTMNGDIWAGAFEWVVGTGTFTGLPTVQFYDPTWTAGTVTDSTTPSYINFTASEPTLLTPVIADFSNATHSHTSDATGSQLGFFPIRDASRGLVINDTSTTVVKVVADELMLQDTSGNPFRITSIDESIDITNSGIHGLDTDSEVVSTWYYIWMVANTTSQGGIISNSPTAPTLPSGYTYKGLFGAVYNDSGGDFDDFEQVDDSVWIALNNVDDAVGTGSNLVDLSAVIPTTAKEVFGSIYTASNAVGGTFANSYAWVSPTSSATMGLRYHNLTGNGTQNISFYYEVKIQTTQSVWVGRGSDIAGGKLYVSGWEY